VGARRERERVERRRILEVSELLVWEGDSSVQVRLG